MEITALEAAINALAIVSDPFRLGMLFLGVVSGLFLGIIPGIGGLVGMALILPFTFTMDPYTAFAVLLGMAAVVNTSDTIPAVLFGVPGTAGAQATVLDGNPMAKNGEAGRALSAAFAASLVGGLVGAVLLAFTVPVLRPLMLKIASPELLAFSIFGIAMVSVLAGSSPVRGVVAACIGVLLSMIGADSQTGTLRFTMDTLYLWDGLPLVPIVLGLFALPELADLAIRRSSISEKANVDTTRGLTTGLQDVGKHWYLAGRGGVLGAVVGAIPGLGTAVVDWIAYAWASQTCKGSEKTFGKGDVRGVIAPEAANNAVTAGALVPTIAFGVPGSASMAILLGVFLIHGLVPGPKMLTVNLDLTYSMIWSVGIANILGAGLCFAFSGQFARVALLRYTLILPPILVFVFIGAFQASRNWGDLYVLLIFAVIGWCMKLLRWPRPPLILGFVLGGLIERYAFISTMRYGDEWISRPIVMVVLICSAVLFLIPLLRNLRSSSGLIFSKPRLKVPFSNVEDWGYLIALLVGSYVVWESMSWAQGAKIGPFWVAWVAIGFASVGVLSQMVEVGTKLSAEPSQGAAKAVHFDTISDYDNLSRLEVLLRFSRFFLYLLAFMFVFAAFGIFYATVFLVIAFMRLETRESWRVIALNTAVITVLVFVIFDRLLRIPWPAPWL
ncbi:MAG: hypothetical protein EBS77_06600 [Gammaproteobacteria bacterium]|nr:hypothetical protein [Gammaproteobacteria bacterium]